MKKPLKILKILALILFILVVAGEVAAISLYSNGIFIYKQNSREHLKVIDLYSAPEQLMEGRFKIKDDDRYGAFIRIENQTLDNREKLLNATPDQLARFKLSIQDSNGVVLEKEGIFEVGGYTDSYVYTTLSPIQLSEGEYRYQVALELPKKYPFKKLLHKFEISNNHQPK